MKLILSPAKRMDIKKPEMSFTSPEFLSETEIIMKKLKTLNSKQLQELMNISPKLAEQNFERNQMFDFDHNRGNSMQAIFAYTGDVYTGLEAKKFNESDLEFAQNTILILSGLYGILRPLDLIQAYRLEMGTELEFSKHKNLYDFWKNKLTKKMNEILNQDETALLVNLASDEYYSAIDTKKIKADILKIQFREYKGEKLQFVSFNAKKARGAMARHIVVNRINDKESIKGFNHEGYYFEDSLSGEKEYWFVKQQFK
jgi:cytoplasmic iron level regulating protein YaaA (DUF328/UPF0246 family)